MLALSVVTARVHVLSGTLTEVAANPSCTNASKTPNVNLVKSTFNLTVTLTLTLTLNLNLILNLSPSLIPYKIKEQQKMGNM